MHKAEAIVLLAFLRELGPPPTNTGRFCCYCVSPISSGNAHTCALRADGSPVCWGDYSLGQSLPPEDERFAVGPINIAPLTLAPHPAHPVHPC